MNNSKKTKNFLRTLFDMAQVKYKELIDEEKIARIISKFILVLSSHEPIDDEINSLL